MRDQVGKETQKKHPRMWMLLFVWLPQLDSNQRSDTCIALSTSVTSSSLDCLFNTFVPFVRFCLWQNAAQVRWFGYIVRITQKESTHECGCFFLCGSPSWTRTNDPAVNSRMLYRLSYRGIKFGDVLPSQVIITKYYWR